MHLSEIETLTNYPKNLDSRLDRLTYRRADDETAKYDTLVGKIHGMEVYIMSTNGKVFTVPRPGQDYVCYVYSPKDGIVVAKLSLDPTATEGTFHSVDVILSVAVQGTGLALLLYTMVIKKLKFNLMSGRLQSPGSQKLWMKLSEVSGVTVYAFDSETDEMSAVDPDDIRLSAGIDVYDTEITDREMLQIAAIKERIHLVELDIEDLYSQLGKSTPQESLALRKKFEKLSTIYNDLNDKMDSVTNNRYSVKTAKEVRDVQNDVKLLAIATINKTAMESAGRIVKDVNTTLDVGMDEIKIQAKKFGNKVSSGGVPPLLHKTAAKNSTPNTLANMGMTEGTVIWRKPYIRQLTGYVVDEPYGKRNMNNLERSIMEGGHLLESNLVDFGEAKQDKILKQFHSELSQQIQDGVSEMLAARTTAYDMGIFDEFEIGSRIQLSTGVFKVDAHMMLGSKTGQLVGSSSEFQKKFGPAMFLPGESRFYRPAIRTTQITGTLEGSQTDQLIDRLINFDTGEKRYKKFTGPSRTVQEASWRDTLKNTTRAAALGLAGLGTPTTDSTRGTNDVVVQNVASSASVRPKASPTVSPEDSKTLRPQSRPNDVKRPQARPNTMEITNSPVETQLITAARNAGITGIELAAFLAQAAHETGGFSRLKEMGSDEYFAQYDPDHAPGKAEALGNTNSGDGTKFKGRGMMHLTGRYNYRIAGEELGIDLEKNPEFVETPEGAIATAIWYWKKRVQPNVSDFSDVKTVTRWINPGLSHLTKREKYFKRYQFHMTRLGLTESQSNSTTWYHGTPDQMGFKSGIQDNKISVEYLDNPTLWQDLQNRMTEARRQDNEDEYFELIEQVATLWKTVSMPKPIFFTDVLSVANTYADDSRAFNYQEAQPGVLKASIHLKNSLTINANGAKFNGIRLSAIKSALSQAGIPADEIDKIISMFPLSVHNDRMKTDCVAVIAHMLKFDGVDVTNVLDSYSGGTTKSTVRMVLDKSTIVLKNDKVMEDVTLLTGYKVMAYVNGRAQSHADSNVSIELKRGKRVSISGNGLYLSNNKEFTLTHYTQLSDHDDVLLTFEYSQNDIQTGSDQDEQSDFTVSRAMLKDFEIILNE